MHGSKDMLCIKKPDEWTDERTDERPRSNMPIQLLRSWGYKNYIYIIYIVFGTGSIITELILFQPDIEKCFLWPSETCTNDVMCVSQTNNSGGKFTNFLNIVKPKWLP